MNKVYFSLILHAHQPVGNFDQVLERAYRDSYLPFLETLRAHPSIRLSLHYSGGLLLWFEHNHPEYFELLRELIAAEQIELIGGGFYEPILSAIPESDAIEQIRRLCDYLEKNFEFRPKGLWLAERVWEPQLPTVLRRAGCEFLAVDDTHFQAAGVAPEKLFGYYFTENRGDIVRLIPGSKLLRYLIPFHGPEETIAHLRRVSEMTAQGLVAMADDLEKFGVWPHTHEHVYTNGWLERFFAALEEHLDWIELLPAGEYLERFPPLGRVYLPTASYSEMMSWALPTDAQRSFEKVEGRLKASPENLAALSFLRGGFFRNFLARYPEANLLHKRMLHTSRRFQEIKNRARFSGEEVRRLWDRGYDHLLRAQANDPYWHGVFGGLYAPHLRLSAQRNLSLAESYADEIDLSLTGQLTHVSEAVDFDCDLQKEIYISTPVFSALIDPHDGATIPFLDFKPAAMDVINGLARRPEVYHEKVLNLPESTSSNEGVKTIHEMTVAKHENLRHRLIYDAYLRNCFRLLVFPHSVGYAEFWAGKLNADPALAAGKFTGEFSSDRQIPLGELSFGAQGKAFPIAARKSFAVSNTKPDEVEIECKLDLQWTETEISSAQAGVELIFNLLAPDESNRYFLHRGGREPLEWQGTFENENVFAMVDAYQKVKIEMSVSPAADWWIMSLFAVSQSEEGFEAVYQGSSVLPHWKVSHQSQQTFNCRIKVRVSRIN